MTQPPDQPPQGGFGAPQSPPPQGGFGAPQDPQQATPPPPAQPPAPPQPGYGPPQQPGPYAQPQQPGPYAQPGYGPPQQPGPYAPPQPGYGCPQQPPRFPGAPTPPPGGGSKNPFKGRPAVAVGAAVAALLVIGGTVYAVSGSGGDKKPTAEKSGQATPSAAASTPVDPGDGTGDGAEDPENLNEGRKAGESKVLWYKEAPDAPGSGADAPSMWITDKAVVKAAYKQVFAYDVGDGDPAWEPISFPQKICAVTPHKTADDEVVVAYMSGISENAKCNRLQQIDLGTGTLGWKAQVADGALFDSTLSVDLSVTGKTLMVGRSQSGTAYDIGTGKKLWDKREYTGACFPTAFAGGAKLISVASCAAGSSKAHDEVQELDPTTGKAKWTRPIPTGWKVARAFSVDPVVLYLTNDDKKAVAISTLKNDGTPRSDVHSKDSFAPECGWAALSRDLQGCTGAVADANTLYLPTEAKSGPNEVVAFNLDTGKEKWRVKSPADRTMLPLRTDGTHLIAYVEPSYSAGGQVVSIATSGGSHTATRLLQNPSGAAQIESGFYAKAIDYVDGRFYISTTRLSGNNQSKEKLMLAYGK
ncbi:outer membrane protein assembly factor BamB family protein [Streptomyces chiangmaiensis]|uniref:PQQ-binding-like beta-propeller repeat protein n=1 Tax=Streptomyces chiangmaiensis TaxID=766497 RepID=A0ABU7FID9_9ACTN|nr:PQQ-binding-like beta-propeller repeat protein [Streptomyces chiangmaiensis]MED7823690.1 PQQ-binding-like beta-propeller repeat protein [Streptomyces chiangmaiensis]